MDAKDHQSFADKISDSIAKFGGSWRFIFAAFFSLICWIILNTLALFDVIHFDPYPFILLNLMLSCLAAFQAPFILMSQRRAERKQDFIYRSLFAEIKDLVESDLMVEHEIVGLYKKQTAQIEEVVKINKKQAEQIEELKKIVQQLHRRDEELHKRDEFIEDIVDGVVEELQQRDEDDEKNFTTDIPSE
jgi:uncharacterized membrane protein